MLKDEGEGEECNVLFAVSDVANFRISAQGQKSKTVFQPLDFFLWCLQPPARPPQLSSAKPFTLFMTATLPGIGHIPMLVASLACMSFTLIYLTGFYVFVDIRTGGTGRSRNQPKVILARCKAVMVSSVITAALVWSLLRVYGAWADVVSSPPS
jgi:hypothetical protein